MKPFVIINTGDRNHASAATLEALRKILRPATEAPAIERSRSIDHCRELVTQAAAENYDAVIAGGGDGTLNIIVNALMAEPPEKRPALGVLPMGTVNCYARSIGLSLDPHQACRQLLDSEARPIGVARINEFHFVCFVSIGFDAAITHKCNLLLKRVIGRYAYFVSGLIELATLKGMLPFRVEGDREYDVAHSLMMSQVRNYGGGGLFPGADPERGELEAFALKRRSRLDLLRMALFWRGYARETRSLPPGIERFRFKKLLVRGERPLYIQVDGEPVTSDNPCELEIELTPNAIRALLPQKPQTENTDFTDGTDYF